MGSSNGSTPLSDGDEAAIRLIAAYTQRYREAGRLKIVTWTGSALLFLGSLACVALSTQTAELGLFAAAYLLSTRTVLRPELTRSHRQGVTLQEQYDVNIYGLPWNEGMAGRRAAQIDIEDLAERFRGDMRALSEQYVSPQNAPHGAWVLLRQLQNMSWGGRDHRRFALISIACLVSSIAATVTLGIVEKLSLSAYVSTLAVPALPWLLDLVDLIGVHWRASSGRAEIEARISDVWDTLASDAGVHVPTATLRTLQDRIYTVRLSFGRVPGWFHARYRERNHQAFQAAANRMLVEKGWSAEDA
jgi:hypothetical protein